MRWNIALSLINLSVCLVVVACGSSGSSPSTASAPPANTSYVNPQVALNGMGNWQQVGGQNYFIPNAQPGQNGQPWAPYQNGSWAYDEQQNWSWNSNDAWGEVTDHYGIWRHHQTYGWMWIPFQDMHYAPHTVTWFDQGEYVGWYPYYAGYAQSYQQYGQRLGFNDGYWLGEQAVLQVNTPGFNLFIGINLVTRAQVTETNVRQYLIMDTNLRRQTAYQAHLGDNLRRVGPYPGGDRAHSFHFIQDFASHKAPVGRAERVKMPNGNLILRPPHVGSATGGPGHGDSGHGDSGHRDQGHANPVHVDPGHKDLVAHSPPGHIDNAGHQDQSASASAHPSASPSHDPSGPAADHTRGRQKSSPPSVNMDAQSGDHQRAYDAPTQGRHDHRDGAAALATPDATPSAATVDSSAKDRPVTDRRTKAHKRD